MRSQAGGSVPVSSFGVSAVMISTGVIESESPSTNFVFGQSGHRAVDGGG